MLTGSFASTYHGPPRTTQDVDLVINPMPEQLSALLARFDPGDYYVSTVAAEEALRHRSMFNVIELATGWKADFIVIKDRPFSREEFARREQVELFGTACWIASAEDTIVSKLEWARKGQSERQLRDVVGVVETRGATLDFEYIERCCDSLGLRDWWARVLAETG